MTPVLDIIVSGNVRLLAGRIDDNDKSRYTRRQRETRATLALLTVALAETPVIDHYPNGAPYLPSLPNLHLSISHSADYVAVALSADTPVGIDIEQPREQLRRIASRVFSTEELQTLTTLDLLLQAWTVKEALYKLNPTPAAADFLHNITLSPPTVDNLPATIVYQTTLTAPSATLTVAIPLNTE